MMPQMRNVMSVLALNPQPTVQVQSAETQARGTPVAVASSARMEFGGKVTSKPGEGVLVPAVTPAVVAQAVPESSGSSSVKAMLAVIYATFGAAVLNALLDAAVQPGALQRLIEAVPYLEAAGPYVQQAVALALVGMLTAWRSSRQKAAVK